MLTDEQNSLIEKVAQENGFQDFTIEVNEGSKKGDNYLGDISAITLKEKDGNKEQDLILKCAIKNEQVRTQIPIGDCYKREVYLYDTVLPAFKELQEKYPLPHPFKSFAKLYGYSLKEGDEWLLFENITKRGFRMFSRKATMDGNHILTVLKEHAKLHSLSFVMKHLEPEQFKTLEPNLQDYFQENQQFEDTWAEGIKNKLGIAYEAMKGNEEATEGLKRCEKEIKSSIEELRKEKDQLVVIHGDSWCNNMMFKYGEENNPTKPTELCFLDWQISKVNTPVLDLCYFMFLSASKDVLDNHKIYLQEYYKVLEENLEAVGCDVERVFPYSMFEEQWKTFTKIGMYIVITMLENLLRDEKDSQTFTDMAQSGDSIFKVFMNQGNTLGQSEQISDRIRNIVLMLMANNYL